MNNRINIIPAMVTPFDANGKIDEPTLEEIVNLLISQGAEYLYVCGSTGECHLMETEERAYVTEAVCQIAKGRAGVIAHVGSLATEISVKLAQKAQQAGAKLLSSAPPFYYKYGFEEIRAFYDRLIESTALPWILYHIPLYTGVAFTPQQVGQFAENARVEGLKYTDQNLFVLEQMKRHAPRLRFYAGHDEVLLPALIMGAEAAIGSAYNYLLPKAVRLTQSLINGDLEEAKNRQREINRIISAILPIGNAQCTKYLLRAYGIDAGACRGPMRKLDAEDCKILDMLFQELA